MDIHDKDNKVLSALLLSSTTIPSEAWKAEVNAYFAKKADSIKETGKNIAGNLIISYVASMRSGSIFAMDAVIQHGFIPTYELLHKHNTVLMEYVTTASNIDEAVIANHLLHVSNLYADQTESVISSKMREYLNSADPFNSHDAIIILSKRSSKNNYDGTQRDLGKAIRTIVEAGGSPSRLDRSNYTSLHWSIIEGNTKLAIQLIRTMDINSCCALNDSGETPLSLSAKNGSYPIVISLLKKGVSTEGYYPRQDVPLKTTMSMSQKIAASNPLLLALKNGHRKIALELVCLGAKFYAVNNSHDMHTSLIYAAKMKDQLLLSAMLKKNFDPNETNSHGFGPLLYLLMDYAESKSVESKKMIEELILKGANFETLSKNGTSPVDVLVKISQSGDGDGQNWLFKRNVEKLQEFVKSSVGLKFENVNDLVISDDNLAEMRLNRIEQVNSVWLNRTAKSDGYKKTLSEKGYSEIKKLSGIVSAVSGGSFAALHFMSNQVVSHAYLSGIPAIKLLTDHIQTASSIITVIAAGIGVLAITKDATKKYAVTKWISEKLLIVRKILIDPVWDLMRLSVDKNIVAIVHKVDSINKRLDLIGSRMSLAISAIKGDMDKVMDINQDILGAETVDDENVIHIDIDTMKRPKADDCDKSSSRSEKFNM